MNLQHSLLLILCSIYMVCAVRRCKSRGTLKLLTMLTLPSGERNLTSNQANYSTGKLGHHFLKSAVELINNSSELLPCHNLSLVIKDDGCSGRDTEADKTATSLVSGLFPQDGSKVVGILGPACSESVRKVVYVASKPEIELVVLHNAYGGSESIFKQTKNSLGILGTTRALFDLSLALIKKSGWENIVILYESSRHFYQNMKDEFIELLAHNANKVTVAVALDVSSVSLYQFNEIRTSGVRIVFVIASLKHSQRILCQAYHMGLVYPAYQWVILSHMLSDIIVPESFDYNRCHNMNNCSQDNLKHVLEKSFLVNFETVTDATRNNNTLFGNNIINGNTTLMSDYSSFDSLWAWANVLHNLTSASSEVVFEYGNASLADLILERFRHLQFKGLSSSISFNLTSGAVERQATLYQIGDGRQRVITTTMNSMVVENWQPFSHISDRNRNVELVHEGVIGLFMVIQGIELGIIITLHVMTIVFRHRKTVKVTSVNLVNFVFIGGYLYIATLMVNCVSWLNVYGSGIDAALCQVVWAWGLPLCFTLVIGIATVRTWRLYRIFVHYLDPGKFLSNPALTAAVLMMVSVDVVIAIIWTSIDPMKFRFLEVTVMIGSQYDVLLEPECYHNIAWLILIFLYKFALLLTLIVLTVLTRKIPSSTFATKSNQMFTYTFSTVLVLGFSLYYIFAFIRHDPYAEFITLFTLLNTMLILFAVFLIIPPLVPVFRNKNSTTTDSKY